MATVFDYLNKLKEENPEYRGYTTRGLYQKLKGRDENLPSCEELDSPTKSRKSRN